MNKYLPPQDKIEEYLESAQSCPYCGSSKISSSDIEDDGYIAWNDVTCNACGKEWREEYSMVMISVAGPQGRIYSDEAEEDQL